MITPKWKQLQDYIASHLYELDPNARSTKASGGSTELHDIKTNCGLAIEAKDYNKKSVYNEDWMQKVIEEIPLHSDKTAILVTRNKDGKVRVHMDFEDFLRIYKEWWRKK